MTEKTLTPFEQLRQPFPEGVVGSLPKPYKADSPKGQCRECGGWHGLPAVHLDYVGHAAVTDRLLTVDPTWTWEPLALDAHGLPAMDAAGNLWIRLTVAGVTRIGVGDGKSMKERIGDALRNAAMRFGVALDLWTKDELESGHAEEKPSRQAPPEARPPRPAQPDRPPIHEPNPNPRETGELISPAQMRKLHATLGDLGLHDDRGEALRQIGGIIGRPLESTKDLTLVEASRVIDHLSKLTTGDLDA